MTDYNATRDKNCPTGRRYVHFHSAAGNTKGAENVPLLDYSRWRRTLQLWKGVESVSVRRGHRKMKSQLSHAVNTLTKPIGLSIKPNVSEVTKCVF